MTVNGKIHIDLAEDSLEGQWVDIANLGLKSPKQFQRIAELAGESTPDSVRAFLAACVPAWSIKNPETGVSLPAPDSPDMDPNDLPMIATKRIADNVREQLEGLLPKS